MMKPNANFRYWQEGFQEIQSTSARQGIKPICPRKNAIDVIYTAIEDNIESADVADIMRKIQNVVDESIENMVAEPHPPEGRGWG